jgi:hypothetical protein
VTLETQIAIPAQESCLNYTLTKRILIMPKYVVERDMPGVGQLSSAELRAVSQNSCCVLSEMGPQIQWVESYITDDKMYAVFIAENLDLVCQHALQSGFPVNYISAIAAIIDPTTAEG